MSAKPDASSAAAAPANSAGGGAAPAAKGKGSQMLPLVLAIVLAPILSWAVGEFVLMPSLEKRLSAVKSGEPGVAHEAAPAEEAGGGHGGGHGGKESKDAGGSPASYEFQNVVVNLAGTMGTRYLKTSFIVTGTNAGIKAAFEAQKPKLTDVTLNVLSSLSLADLEEPGSKNLLREKLVLAYNQALGKRVAEQVYFSDFVVQ